MITRIVFFCLLIGLLVPGQNSQAQENTKNPKLSITDDQVRDLNGAYSVISIDDDGKTQHINFKFDNGKLSSFVLNGNEIPQEDWAEYNHLLKEFITYLSPEDIKKHKYNEVFELEDELRQNIAKMEKTIKQLEISKRFELFYDNELKHWIKELEQELNESEFVQDMEAALDDLLHDLDDFLEQRKEYYNNKEELK
ncbi:MAG: hypothetical protein HN936_18445 [Bacteroidetes bacterium]|jgi:hypothetical protein|nr:hypothetical protein [Bacteroidota bacterium]MBT4400350.1 hypothetical protein [Bacteroidota bacterium]MBT4410886.1 hypothetical protein [Bacteroidota bacterium]MBT7095231.1 hypothetical protein [Bacteroidota bacterium]MBT7463360.1 hypothetical protein [Bacteroidota bacterium]